MNFIRVFIIQALSTLTLAIVSIKPFAEQIKIHLLRASFLLDDHH